MTFLVMVTGSRTWDRPEILEEAIDHEARRLNVQMNRDEYGHPLDWDWTSQDGIMLLHGACPSGADVLADQYAATHETHVRTMPADWNRYGKAAGFRRNNDMVRLRPDVVIGLVDACKKPAHQMAPHGSHGAIHALSVAQAAHLRTVVYYRGFYLDHDVAGRADLVIKVPR